MAHIGQPKKQRQKPADKRYKHCTAEEAQKFKRDNGVMGGGIHTASFFLPGYYLNEDSAPLAETTYRTVTAAHTTTEGGTSLKFNPNNYRGACESMGEYQAIKQAVLMNLHYEATCATRRVDFKIDSNPPPEASAFWGKVCDLFVYAFMAYKNIAPKGRARTDDPITGVHKETKGATKGFEFAHYNKSIQKPREGIASRLELRRKAMNDPRNKRRLNEWDAINSLKQVVAALPAYYDLAVFRQLERLCADYNEVAPTLQTPRSPTVFLRAKRECVFNRQQIEAFAIRAKIEHPAKFASNFVRRNPAVVLVEQSDLVKLCAVIGDMMDSYITGQHGSRII